MVKDDDTPGASNGAGFEYDVAFSFLKEDEGLAAQLNDLLEGRYKTFLYSKKQEALGGRDGEEVFKRVFGKASRIVVILYRPEWGSTPWTRIEQDAIRDRAYNSGYDFTTFVSLGPSPSVPEWLPKHRLWVGLDRFSVNGAAAIIENLITEQGGNPKPDTPQDKAARLARALAADNERESLYHSTEGVQRGEREAHRVFEALDALVESNEGKQFL